MDNAFAVVLIAAIIITAFGMSHLNMTDADKADLATKTVLYQKFIGFCRVGFILLVIGIGVYACSQALSRSSGGSCDWDSHGEHCDAY